MNHIILHTGKFKIFKEKTIHLNPGELEVAPEPACGEPVEFIISGTNVVFDIYFLFIYPDAGIETMETVRNKSEFLICGAGIIGLTIAQQLVRLGKKSITIIDKEPFAGYHASSRNSGILHAGIYYAPDTFKAKSCLAGNQLMKEYCKKRNLALMENGKVIVTKSQEELETLHILHHRARDNNVPAEIISDTRCKEIEPYSQTYKEALWSPETAAIDPKEVLQSLVQELSESGVQFHYCCALTSARDKTSVETTSGTFTFDFFINAAGAYADKVARFWSCSHNLTLIPFKGTYKRLVPEKNDQVKGNIYPVPDLTNPFLGIHFSKNIRGEVYIGPSAIPAFGREHYGIVKGVDSEAIKILFQDCRLLFSNPGFRAIAKSEPLNYIPRIFYNEARKLLSGLQPRDIYSSSKCGIRPQLVDTKKGELVMDFVLESTENSVHVLNAISPAFTASMEMARIIVGKFIT